MENEMEITRIGYIDNNSIRIILGCKTMTLVSLVPLGSLAACNIADSLV